MRLELFGQTIRGGAVASFRTVTVAPMRHTLFIHRSF